MIDRKTSGTELLTVEDLRVDLMTGRGIVYVVNNVSFSVGRGEIHGLVGESGCGKTIMAKAVMGLCNRKRSRVAGSIRLENRELLGLPESEMRKIRGKRISMIFQDPMTSLSPLETIGAQLEETLANHFRLSARERHNRALKLLEWVGLQPAGDRHRQYPFELSGGMQQRVMIACAIACEPELLIADEPSTALDVTIQAQILSLLRRLQQELGMSVLLITHNFAVVAEICDRVSVMYAGEIIETADTKTLLTVPVHPYSRMLLECIPRGYAASGGAGQRLKVIPGSPPQLRERPGGCSFANRCPDVTKACAGRPEPCWDEGGHTVLCRRAKEERAYERHFA
jgi:oligopeptide/dipeptide ABC transporter ATP-binding protein